MTARAEAVGCRTPTVEHVRREFVVEGFVAALIRKKWATPPGSERLDGAGEAKRIALRLGKPPAGYGHWTLRLLADQLVELEVVDALSRETVRQTLKRHPFSGFCRAMPGRKPFSCNRLQLRD
jgi:hypothetical protein